MKATLGPEPRARELTLTLTVGEAKRLMEHLKLICPVAQEGTPVDALRRALWAALEEEREPAFSRLFK